MTRLAGPARLCCLLQQQHLLDWQHEHQAPERVEEDSAVLDGLCAQLMLVVVQRDAQLLTQVHPPLVQNHGSGQAPAAHRAAAGEAFAGLVSFHPQVEDEVFHTRKTKSSTCSRHSAM